MTDRTVNCQAINDLLHGVLSSLHKVSGGSAAAVMRMAGGKMLEALHEDGIELSNGDNHIEDIGEKMRKFFKDDNFCEDFEMKKVDDGVTIHVTNCAFWETTKKLREDGVPPYACPFANLGMAIIQEALGLRSRVDKITPGNSEGDSDIHLKFV